MSRTKHQLYEADDADFDEAGNRINLQQQDGEEDGWNEEDEWGEGEFEGFEGEEDDYEYGPGVTVIRAEKPAAPQTDLADEYYLDPLALVNCWEGALLDLKDMHPDRFLPPTEAPRSLAQKQARAPIWYGPPPSAASTSKLPPPAPSASLPSSTSIPSSYSAFLASSASASSAPPLAQEQQQQQHAQEEEEEQLIPTKKRKRLTGSQKKARKAAKLEAAASASGGLVAGFSSAGKGKERALDGDVVEEEEKKEEALPRREQPPHLPLPASHTPTAPPVTSHPSPPRPAPSRPPHPSSFSFLVPPIGRLPPPSSLTGPPPITPLTGEEPPLEPEAAGGLLESMMWSYYTAGYQTALYHAAIGVAKFKHEMDESSASTAGGAGGGPGQA